MPKFTFPLVLCVGAIALMALPLLVPVSFGKGVAGRSSLFPEWMVAVFFYTIMAVIAILSGRAAFAELRGLRWRARSVWSRRVTEAVRPGESVELANIAAGEGAGLRVSLLEVRSDVRVQFVGRISLRCNPPLNLGEFIYSEGALVSTLEADLPAGCGGTLEWVTSELETENSRSTPILVSLEIRLLAPAPPSRRGKGAASSSD